MRPACHLVQNKALKKVTRLFHREHGTFRYSIQFSFFLLCMRPEDYMHFEYMSLQKEALVYNRVSENAVNVTLGASVCQSGHGKHTVVSQHWERENSIRYCMRYNAASDISGSITCRERLALF